MVQAVAQSGWLFTIPRPSNSFVDSIVHMNAGQLFKEQVNHEREEN